MALQYINMKGDVKQVQEHLAFDVSLQKQMNFFPCDENGKPIAPLTESQVQEVKKKDVVHVESDSIKDYPIEITIPEGVELVNPLDEDDKETQTVVVTEPKKRGRKPKQS